MAFATRICPSVSLTDTRVWRVTPKRFNMSKYVVELRPIDPLSARKMKPREFGMIPEAKARASGSERETGRARGSEIFPVSDRQYITCSDNESKRTIYRTARLALILSYSKAKIRYVQHCAICAAILATAELLY